MSPTTDRASVVIESARRSTATAQLAALEGGGFSVTHCGGPPALPRTGCPLTAGQPCRMLDTADVVVHDLDLDDPDSRAVLRELHRTHPDVPVVLEIPKGTAREHAAVLAGCYVVFPFDMSRLVAAVADAVDSPRPPAGLTAPAGKPPTTAST